ncbi:MAG: SIS domain-containing protein [bacterium]
MLDNIEKIKKLDKELVVAKSIESLPAQIKHVQEEIDSIVIPEDYKNITHVVVNGMGGSNLGARLIQAALEDKLKIPLEICPGYSVPNHVDDKTLYIISSYSGTTEEPISVFSEVEKRGAKILTITSDSENKLAKIMDEHNIPGYRFLPKENPSNQPRLGVGYGVFGIMSMLAKAGVFKLGNDEMNVILNKMKAWGEQLGLEIKTKNNIAKQLAQSIHGREAIYVGAEFLSGNLHVIRNQTCESSKNFASYLTLPELNHYTMEGLSNPKNNQKNLIFVFFNSALYNPRIQKRSKLTQQVAEKNKIKTVSHELRGETKLEQAFELLQLGGWITYYLGILNKVDPIKIPWVDWFKEQLK